MPWCRGASDRIAHFGEMAGRAGEGPGIEETAVRGLPGCGFVSGPAPSFAPGFSCHRRLSAFGTQRGGAGSSARQVYMYGAIEHSKERGALAFRAPRFSSCRVAGSWTRASIFLPAHPAQRDSCSWAHSCRAVGHPPRQLGSRIVMMLRARPIPLLRAL